MAVEVRAEAVIVVPSKIVWIRIQVLLAVHDWRWATPTEYKTFIGLEYLMTTGNRR